MLRGNKLMTATQQMFWFQKYIQSSQLMVTSRRSFAHNEEHGAHQVAAHHGQEHSDEHHDEHHQHVEKFDPNHKLIADSNRKFLAYDGLKGTSLATLEIENPYRHHNDLGLLHYAFSHTFEEEHNLHDEPYGYWIGDDPFEEQGQADYPWILLFAAIIAFTHFTYAHFRFDRRKVGEVLYHQRLTAFQIEDEIRRIREEDATIRGYK